ncbi:MAG: hypothetical protein WCW61_02660 [Patescibacteria group bacterium]|jgi:hypothetical protein
MNKNIELSLEEWKIIGDATKEVIKANNKLFSVLKEKLPKMFWEKKWFVSENSFGSLRSHLDDIICGKFLDLPDREVTSIFYGTEE